MPIPGIPDRDLRKLSRQQRYKLRRYAEGLCTSCGKVPRCEQSRTLCADCLGAQRERMRERTGAGRRNYRSKSYDPSTVERRRIEAVRGKLPFGLPKPKAAKRAAAGGKAGPSGADEPSR